ncbi:MAG: hypothetical protein CSB15_00735 [Clostridiales bacterium]|nr:MAG: hypothetical protein CSB15_00735 [Clostridiales bacterium]
MKKTKILIADKDLNYIIPLQLKFMEEFFGKIELEIIDDVDYFYKFFSSPKDIDILIISEELYSVDLKKHDINKIFIMRERFEETESIDESTTYIFKYTSVVEIFNIIIGISKNTFNLDSIKHNETKVILFYSASGGVGKTTLAVGLCASLAKNYKKALYINASHLQFFSHMFENFESIQNPDIYLKLNSNYSKLYNEIKPIIRKEKFFYMPPFKASLISHSLDYSIYEKIINSAKSSGEYDFIIVDADTTFDEKKLSIINMANKVVIVTNQNKVSVRSTNVLMSNINIDSSEKYVFICNNFDSDIYNDLVVSNSDLKFSVADYVEHFYDYENLSLDELSNKKSIQKMMFLFI